MFGIKRSTFYDWQNAPAINPEKKTFTSEVLKFEENKVYVSYQGACGTCPSSTTGTLMAIEGILKDEFNPSVEVIPI